MYICICSLAFFKGACIAADGTLKGKRKINLTLQKHSNFRDIWVSSLDQVEIYLPLLTSCANSFILPKNSGLS